MTTITLLIAALIAIVAANAQTPTWTETDQSDLLHRTSFKEFSLQGKFLIPPQRSSLAAPVLVLHCQPGRRGKSLVNGSFVEGWISVGAVLNSTVMPGGQREPRVRVPVEYRLDDQKLQGDGWPVSTDHSGLILDDFILDTLLYGHMLSHREGTNAQVTRIMLGIPEYLAAQIQIQFDLPDSTEVADACGVILHKRKR